ncbi:MAG: DoxX family protein [Paludibacteraceae bacterium]|nr:DoxX family protein [Paludibacteraceae bacterium]
MNKTAHIIGSICRTLLGITFIFSGFVKAVDPLGTVYKIEDYLMAFGGWFTDLMPLAGTAAVILIAMEWTLGVCMLFNVRTSITSWLSLAFYLVMTPLTLWIALTNPVSDCGCFGDAIVLTNWQTFWKNVVLLILVIVLLGCKRFIPQLLSWWGELVVLLIALGASAAVMTYSYTHLPPMDFRPYKVGNHIPTLMEVPEGAPVDEYAITLIYEKDGVEQEFTLENYPKGDDSWTFVDQRSVLIKKGYEAPIHDFEILTMNFEDITYDILESEDPITLITMYDLDKTNRTQVAKLMGIYNACMERGELCYFLTGSGEEQIYAFGEEIGMDMETIESTFCTIDPVTLKTIVRANPGMFVVQNGTILEKHNLKQLNQHK